MGEDTPLVGVVDGQRQRLADDAGRRREVLDDFGIPYEVDVVSRTGCPGT